LAGRQTTIDAKEIWRYGDAEALRRLALLEGHAAPPLSVEGWYNTGGQKLTLNNLHGKVVLLDFWGVWCGACIAEFPSFQRLREKYREQGFEIVGIHTTDDGKRMAEFARNRKLSWPIGVDVSDKTKSAYRVAVWPSLYLVDRNGILRIALPHPYQLEEQVHRLLSEPTP
jgi:thiol-disulfide isomerase/thioredoxin